MHDAASRRPDESRTTRSARPALSPYFVEEVAMTRSDVLRARGDGAPGYVGTVTPRSPEWTGALAA